MARPPKIRVGRIRGRAVRGPRDDGTWYWRAEVADGKGGTRSLWSGWATPEKAEEILLRLATDGVDESQDGEAEVLTVRDLLDLWGGYQLERADAGEIRPRTMTSYRISVERLAEIAGDQLLARLDKRAVNRIRLSVLRRFASTTAHLHLSIFTMALQWGWDYGLLGQEPPSVDLPKPRPREKYTPTAQEVARTLEHIHVPWAKLAMRILWSTGARKGAVAHIRTEDWHTGDRILHLHTTKTGPRDVPIGASLAAQLDAWEPGEVWFLAVSPHTARHIDERIRDACDAAGIRRWTPHALRRLAVDTLARSGVDVATAASLLGHSPAVMLQAYRQVDTEDRRRAILTARLGEVEEVGQVIEIGSRTCTTRTDDAHSPEFTRTDRKEARSVRSIQAGRPPRHGQRA